MIPDLSKTKIPSKEAFKKMEMPKLNIKEMLTGLKENKIAFYGVIGFGLFIVLVTIVFVVSMLSVPAK